jgi:uncharacterized membrane protein
VKRLASICFMTDDDAGPAGSFLRVCRIPMHDVLVSVLANLIAAGIIVLFAGLFGILPRSAVFVAALGLETIGLAGMVVLAARLAASGWRWLSLLSNAATLTGLVVGNKLLLPEVESTAALAGFLVVGLALSPILFLGLSRLHPWIMAPLRLRAWMSWYEST